MSTANLRTEVGSLAAEWWSRLKECPGARARLRRCGSVLEIILEPEVHSLRRAFQSLENSRVSIETVALIAGTLAWVEEASNESMGEQLGKAAEQKTAIQNRMRRLLKEERGNYDRLLDQWRRVLALLAGRANPAELSKLIFFWGDTAKKRFATDFYEHIK